MKIAKEDKDKINNLWKRCGKDIPWVQDGLEELLYRFTDGYIWTDYLWDYGMNEFYDWEKQYGNKIYDMVNLRCGKNCYYADKTKYEQKEDWCNMTDIPEKDVYNFACSCCADVKLNMIEVLLFLGPYYLLALSQERGYDYRLVYEVLKEYGYYYENNKLERLLNDYNICKRWEYIINNISSKKIKIADIIDDENNYEFLIEDKLFRIYKLDLKYKCREYELNNSEEIINKIPGSHIIKWNIELLENLEQLYDLK